MDHKGSRQPGVRILHLPECPVCWVLLSEEQNVPLVLHCGHTLCRGCVEQLVMTGSEPGKKALQCPECRLWCLWSGKLPKNFMLLRTLSCAVPAEAEHPSLGSAQKDPVRAAPSHCSGSDSETMKAWLSGMLDEKVWQVARLIKTLILFLCFLPLSFMHMFLWWWTAILGGIVFCWFSLGGLGMGVFFTFVTGTCHVSRLLLMHVSRQLFGDRVESYLLVRSGYGRVSNM